MHAYLCSLTSHIQSRGRLAVYSPLSSLGTPRWDELGAVLALGKGWRGCGMWEQWQQLEQYCHCFLCTSTGPKNACPRVWIRAKWQYCLRENALFWQMQQSLRFSLLYFQFCTGPGAYVHPKAFALHTSGNSAILSPTSYHSFVLTFSWSQSFAQTRKHESIQDRKMRSWMSSVKTNAHWPIFN